MARPRRGGPRRPSTPKHRANPGRVAAAKALLAADIGQFVDEELARRAPREGPDRGLAWFLALGTLRHRGEVDASLRPHLRQPLASLDGPVRATLRLGAFEKLYGRAGDHAVVDQGVEVCRALRAPKASGMVNAILRRVQPVEDLARAERLNHPEWLVARWDKRYGAEATERWCRANNEDPPLVVATKPHESDRCVAAWRAAGLEVTEAMAAGQAVAHAFRLTGHHGKVEDLDGFNSGDFWVQDASAAATADLVEASGDMRVLDACAAPGGKTLRLLSQGAEVVATDRSQSRLGRLRDSLRRTSLSAELRVHDWTSASEGQLYDAVLVDAPCTGLGTCRRSPEVRWSRVFPDVLKASTRQLAILKHASARVRPGGALVYAVCSSEPEEGDLLVKRFLATQDGWSCERTLETAPPQHDEDGFFAARLVRA